VNLARSSSRQLGSALQRLLVVSERYPELRANQNFRDLQAQLEGTENRITVARGRFNESAQGYNTVLKKFPTNLMAGLLGFKRSPTSRRSPGRGGAEGQFGSARPRPHRRSSQTERGRPQA
jgi:LemA protein